MKQKIFLILLLLSCSSESSIDRIIEKYDSVDFSNLKNRFIYFRSNCGEPLCSIYFVSKFGGTCPPYVVEFSHWNNQIIFIKDHLMLNIDTCQNYLTKVEIENTVNNYVKYDLCVLGVDSLGNVYINPHNQARPTLLRKNPHSTPKDLNLYKLYKGNWYILKDI